MLLNNYQTEDFFDEMFASDGVVRPHYQRVADRLHLLDESEHRRKQTAVDLAFMRGGVTFTVYNDDQGTERIFPFDLMPRVIPDTEWQRIEKGLIQRITALNLFLHDIYHEQKILKDRVIPPHYILGAKHFRREFMGFNVPKDIYVHICGTDLIRDRDGNYVLFRISTETPGCNPSTTMRRISAGSCSMSRLHHSEPPNPTWS